MSSGRPVCPVLSTCPGACRARAEDMSPPGGHTTADRPAAATEYTPKLRNKQKKKDRCPLTISLTKPVATNRRAVVTQDMDVEGDFGLAIYLMPHGTKWDAEWWDPQQTEGCLLISLVTHLRTSNCRQHLQMPGVYTAQDQISVMDCVALGHMHKA